MGAAKAAVHVLHAPLGMTREGGSFVRDTKGQVAIEYLVLVGTMAIVLIPAFVATGRAIVTSFEKTRNAIAHPVP